MLKDRKLINIILKDVVGNHASSALYNLGHSECTNKTVSDLLYLPIASNLLPIIVEIQNKVNKDFIERAIKYCISLKEEYGVQPLMLIFSIKGFDSERFKSKFINTINFYLDEVSCDLSVQNAPKSIENNHLLQTPLNPLVL